MLLKGDNPDHIAMQILTRGGMEFLSKLEIKKINNKRRQHPKCACCKKRIKEEIWILAFKGNPVFKDLFHERDCVNLALRWLIELFFFHHLGSEISNLRDPLPLLEGESMREYGRRYLEFAATLPKQDPQASQ